MRRCGRSATGIRVFATAGALGTGIRVKASRLLPVVSCNFLSLPRLPDLNPRKDDLGSDEYTGERWPEPNRRIIDVPKMIAP